MKFPLLSNAYTNNDGFESSRTINFRAELATDPNSKDIVALIGTAGLKYKGNLVNWPVRSFYSFNNELFAVVQSSLVTVDTTVYPWAVKEILGTLNTATGRVTIKDNGLSSSGLGGNQLLIIDGLNGYIFDVSTRVFTTIDTATGGFLANPTGIAYIDGYFVVINDSMSTSCSDLLDGLTWNALATAQIMGSAGNNKAVIANSEMLYYIKEDSMEIWQNIGVATSQGFPFQRIQGAVINYGTDSPYTWLKIFTSVYGLDPSGVVLIQGGVPIIISPPAFNTLISQATDLTQCFAWTYNDSGHTYYVLTNPVDNWTWQFDINTQFWNELSSYIDTPYTVGRHLVDSCTVHNNMNIIGDYSTGNIYELSSKYFTDAGKPICSIRILSPLFEKKDLDPFCVSELVIDAQTGVGRTDTPTPAIAKAYIGSSTGIESIVLTDGGADYLNDEAPIIQVIPVDGQGSGAVLTPVMSNGSVQSITITNAGSGYTYPSPPMDLVFSGPNATPYLSLSWSNNDGKTWSNEIAKPLGSTGANKKKTRWTRLGYTTNNKIFRLICTDNCKKSLYGAYIT